MPGEPQMKSRQADDGRRKKAEGSAPKHTPGPWIAERFGCVTAIVDGRRVQVAAAMGQGPMYGPPETPVTEISAANARLIAAAPELLEALRALAEFADNGTPVQPGALVWDEVRAAIAKAESSR